MSKLDSTFGGRLVWFDRFLGDGSAGSEVALAPQYVYTETNAGFTSIRGATGMSMVIPAASSVGGYTDKQHLRCKYLTLGANIEMLMRYTGVTGTEQFPIIWLRGNGTVAGSNLGAADDTCYYMQQTPLTNSLDIERVSASAQTSLGTFAFTAVAADLWMRLAAVGTNIYGKIWQEGTSEPADWGIKAANAEIPRGNHFGIGLSGGNDPNTTWTHVVKELYVWDLDLSEREAAIQL